MDSTGVAVSRSAPDGADALENYANNSSPPSLRVSRYARRGVLWDLSTLERVRKCGRTRHDAQGVALRRTAGGVVGFSGVCTCGSVWACPVCNAKIMARRALEIGGAVAAWQSRGGRCVFLTLTMRHHRGQRLSTLWDSLSAAWKSVTGGKQWVNDRRRFGIAGWLRVVEVTQGLNGWHVHVHGVLFLEPNLSTLVDNALDVAELHGRLFGRWSRALQRRGLGAPLAVGQDAHLVTGPADEHLARYFTKAVDGSHRLGLELTQTQSKATRSAFGTASTWSLLDLVESAGVLDGWEEWEQASKGRRQLTWSKGLRELLGLRCEKSDEEVAAEEIGSRDDDLVLITPEGWRLLCSAPRDLGELLDVAQAGGLSAARVYLDARGVPYEVLGGK